MCQFRVFKKDQFSCNKSIKTICILTTSDHAVRFIQPKKWNIKDLAGATVLDKCIKYLKKVKYLIQLLFVQYFRKRWLLQGKIP